MLSHSKVLALSAAFIFTPLLNTAQETPSPDWPQNAFTPTLETNDLPTLCTPILDQVKTLRRRDQYFNLSALDLGDAVPTAKITVLPDNERANEGFGRGGFYDGALALPGDWDADGADDTLVLRSIDIGWRYLGVRADIETSSNAAEPTVRNAPDTPPLFQWSPVESITFIKFETETYTLSWQTERRTQRHTLYVLPLPKIAETQTYPVCAISLAPNPESYFPLLTSDPFVMGLVDLYGGDGLGHGGVNKTTCRGTMGWTARPLTSHFDILFNRPHRMKAVTRQTYSVRPQAFTDSLREGRLLKWAVTDPQSWQDYRAFKAAREDFTKRLQRHYRSALKLPEKQAQTYAEEGWRYLIDKTVYARNPDGWMQPFGGTDAVLTAAPNNTPQALAAALLAYHNKSNARGQTKSGYYKTLLSKITLRAALYARLPLDQISPVAAGRDAAIQDDIRRRVNEADIDARTNSALQTARDGDLIAAIGSAPHMQWALDRGASPDAATPGFGKTVLMYAAQNNDLETVKYLIEAGANINAATKVQDTCLRLTYDNRTAMTYAAQSGGLALIQYLIQSGADMTHTDSKGRTLRSYLALNETLSDDERAAIQAFSTP